jgi:uncharacterized protein YbaP (TraB family)
MKLFPVIICTLFALPSFGQQKSFPDSCHTLLWGVVNASGDTSYVFGTFHEFGNTYFDGYIPLRRKYDEANCIAIESIPEGEPGKYKRPVEMEDWVKKLSKQDRRLIEHYLKRTKSAYTLKFLRNMPPASLAYYMESEMAEHICDTRRENDVVGIDEYIMNGAISYSKKLFGLESPYDTFNVVNTMMGAKDNNDPNGFAKVKDIIINNDKYKDTIVAECWEAENYKNLDISYRFSKSSVEDDPHYDLYLDRRNNSWMPKVRSMIDSNKAFIAVGMKHLFYKKGLIMQLVNSGYTVFPVAMAKNAKPVKYTYRRR